MSLKNWWHGKLSNMVARALPTMDVCFLTSLHTIVNREVDRRFPQIPDFSGSSGKITITSGSGAFKMIDPILKLSAAKLPKSKKSAPKKKKSKTARRG